MLSSIFDRIKSFFKNDENIIIAPCVGDLIEFEDGTRTMVASVSVDNDVYDVRFFKNTVKCVNQRGRQKTVMEISKNCELWPPENSKIIRDSCIVYPVKNWKISFINWLSKKLLK